MNTVVNKLKHTRKTFSHNNILPFYSTRTRQPATVILNSRLSAYILVARGTGFPAARTHPSPCCLQYVGKNCTQAT
jgi:hypothetical protein